MSSSDLRLDDGIVVELKTYIVELDTDRFGDWKIVKALDEDGARKAVRRMTRKPIRSVTRSRPTKEWLALRESEPRPAKRRRRK